MTKEKERLGRGLSALLSSDTTQLINENNQKEGVTWVDVQRIRANPYQPRQKFEMDKLVELADSIRSKGILQPLIVKQDHDQYVLILGERRLRAAKIAGIEKVPVIIKEVTEQDMLEMAVLENVQREELSSIEEASAYNQLITDFKIPSKVLAQKIGKSEPYISNKIRLLKLSPEIQRALVQGEITEGHARALLGLDSLSLQIHAMRLIIHNQMNVRQAEKLISRLKTADKESEQRTKKLIQYILSTNAIEIQKSLSDYFKLPTTIVPLKEGGKIIIRYKDEDELKKISEVIKKD